MMPDGTAAAADPPSGAWPALRTPPSLPAIPDPDAIPVAPPVPDSVGRVLVDEARRLVERADAARLRNAATQSRAIAWLADRGISPSGASLRRPRPAG